MDYQRALNHERLIYNALDQAKTSLQSNMTEFENDHEQLESYLKKSFSPKNHLKNVIFV